MIRISLKGIAGALGLGAVCAGALFTAEPAMAQDYPTKPVTLVVGFPPGGSTDVVARILAGHMTDTLGQPVVVENRAGAGGSVAIAHVANSDPDGYTVGVSGVGTSILIAALGKDPGFSMDDDLDVVGIMGTLGLLIAGRTDLEPKTLPDLIEYAKANPGDIAYGTSGVGTPGHLAMEYLAATAGIDVLHIPYKGNTPLMNDVLGGHVDVAMLTTPGAAEQVRAKGIMPYAVSSVGRSSLMPEVPTVSESGFEGYSAQLWNLMVVPTGTPDEIQSSLSAALNAAMEAPEVLEAYGKQGLAPTLTTPAEASAFLAAERAKWQGVIKDAGIAIE